MSIATETRASPTRGAWRQFILGIALVSAIPLLAIWYVRTAYQTGETSWHLLAFVCTLIVILGIVGYVLLRPYPINITKLRGHLERVAHGDFTSRVSLVKAEADSAAIERYANMMVKQLKEKIEAAEHERARLEQKLARIQKQLALDTISASIAHDFNNYLSAILGNTGLILSALPLESPAGDSACRIESIALQAVDLVNSLCSCSSRVISPVELLDVSKLVADASDSLRAAAGKHCTLEFHLAENPPPVTGNREQLTMAVKNIVANAGEALVDGDGKVSIRTGVRSCDKAYLDDTYFTKEPADGDYVFIEISDNGPGMTPDVQTRIFDPFFSTKIRGRGMGLPVAFGIVRAHNGVMRVESAPGNGSAFIILLPVASSARQGTA